MSLTWLDMIVMIIKRRDWGNVSKPAIETTAHKLALAGEQAGFTLEEMISMLDCGITMEILLGLIELRLASQKQPEKPIIEAHSSWWVM